MSVFATRSIISVQRQQSLLLGLSFVLVWCSGYIAGKLVVTEAAPFTSLVCRFALAAMCFAVVSVRRWAGCDRRALWHSVVVGVLMQAMQFGGVYGAFALGASSGVAALVIGTMPILVALVACIQGSEWLSFRQWVGMSLGLAGVAAVAADRIDGATSWPAWLALVVGLVGITCGTLYQKRYVARIDMRVSLTLQNLAATLVLMPFALSEGFRFAATPVFFGSLVWLVLVNSVGGFVLLFLLIRRGAASQVAALFFLVPPVAAVFGYWVLGEHLTWLKTVGFVLAAVGLWLATRPRRGVHATV